MKEPHNLLFSLQDLSILDNWLKDFLFNPSSSSFLEQQNFLQVWHFQSRSQLP